MRQIRAACPRPEKDNAVPNEIMYADDTDFISTSREVLTVNDPHPHRECCKCHSANLESRDQQRQNRANDTQAREKTEDELWRNTKKLGTLLDDSKEIRSS